MRGSSGLISLSISRAKSLCDDKSLLLSFFEHIFPNSHLFKCKAWPYSIQNTFTNDELSLKSVRSPGNCCRSFIYFLLTDGTRTVYYSDSYIYIVTAPRIVSFRSTLWFYFQVVYIHIRHSDHHNAVYATLMYITLHSDIIIRALKTKMKSYFGVVLHKK